MSVAYLDIDDEITDAVARLRATTDRWAIFVLPPGSRIATSRINFRLLAREAQHRGITLAVVSGEAGVRALAISAGLPAHGTIDESEAALGRALAEPATGTPPVAVPPVGPREGAADAQAPGIPAGDAGIAEFRRPSTGARSDAMSDSAPPAPAGPVPPVPPGPAVPPVPAGPVVAPHGTPGPGHVADGAARRPAPPAVPFDDDATRGYSVAPRGPGAAAGRAAPPIPVAPYDSGAEERERRRTRPQHRRRGILGTLVRLVLVAAVLGGLGYAAYLFLPSATIVLHPRAETAGPITLRVVADPAVAVPDPEAGLIPAEPVDVPLSATGDFPATGTDVTQTRATGVVRFTSENTLFDVPIAEGTRLSTADGVEFETLESVVVPKASIDGGRTTAEARVRAVRPGPGGNVAAETIERVPETIGVALVTATNPERTTGGARRETKVIARRDYEAALEDLESRLDAALDEAVADPATTPRGLVLFPETAERGRITVDQAAGDLVDTPAERFTLSAEAVGRVLAVNEELLRDVAIERLAATVTDDFELFIDTVTTSATDGTVQGGRIVYDVTAQGEQYRPPDRAELIAAVRGKNVSEARAILAEYGSVEITFWPEFIDTMPDQAGRIDLSIVDPR